MSLISIQYIIYEILQNKVFFFLVNVYRNENFL